VSRFIVSIIQATGFRPVTKNPITNDAIEPAAEALIREHGLAALSEAARQVSALNSNGLYALAATWQQIRQKIVERQQLEESHSASN
jgi:hypothetical protein